MIDGVDPDEADWEALAGDVLPIDGSSLLLTPVDLP